MADLTAMIGERVLETTAGRWLRGSWDQFASERTRLIGKGGVADVAGRLLPKLEWLKAGSAVAASDSEALAGGWGGRAKVSKEALDAVPPDKYVANRTIRDVLVGGDVVLVKGSWLLKRSSGYGALPPRRELEAKYPSALWKVDDLMELAETGAVAVVAVSYCWCSEEHPDPQGEQMQVVRNTLRQFLDSTPLEDVALFIDWCSLHQKPGSSEEEVSFERASRTAHLLYLHQGVRVWMLTAPPAAAQICAPYAGRAWTSFQRALGEMLTKGNFLLDLGLLDDRCTSWDQTVTVCKHRRLPPLTPDVFAEDLSTKIFMQGMADQDHNFLVQQHEQAFFEAIVAAEELAFNEVGWGDKEARVLALALSQCQRLRKITLYGNRIEEAGALALTEVLSRLRSVEEVWLTGNPVGKSRDAKLKLADAWAKAERPDALRI